eukprot:1089883_1
MWHINGHYGLFRPQIGGDNANLDPAIRTRLHVFRMILMNLIIGSKANYLLIHRTDITTVHSLLRDTAILHHSPRHQFIESNPHAHLQQMYRECDRSTFILLAPYA